MNVYRSSTRREGMGMKKLLIVIVIAVFCYLYFGGALAIAQDHGSSEKVNNINGVFEWISEEVRTTRPNNYSLTTSENWQGQWQIYDGYFSSVLMKRDRFNFFDRKNSDLGYESFAGTYMISKDEIVFVQTFSLNPLYNGRPVTMKYRLNGDKLVLKQILRPTIEDSREGEITITLKRRR
ncbi:MAG: hypothetical protein ABI539_11635 [Acidobacteriota bacterium]